MIYERIYAQLEQLGVIALIRENAEAATSESRPYMDLHFNRLYESEGVSSYRSPTTSSRTAISAAIPTWKYAFSLSASSRRR